MRFPLISPALLLSVGLSAQTGLEMGKMWTFENPPLAYLEKEYGFKPDQKWLNSLRLASLRFGGGCSASFVSPKGLIMTNHHCARDNIAGVQGANDYIRDGYTAATLEDEIKLPNLTVQQLISTRDVTAAMNAGIADGDDAATISKKRKANEAKVMDEARAAHPDLTPQVVTMHNGAAFMLYSYKIYRDIRLVCAPHLQASHFGGDPDNFTYPRFGLDFTFCRAYENGKPVDTSAHYFRWSQNGPKKGELAFVTGNPGSTGRLNTQGQMAFLREARYPLFVDTVTDNLEIAQARAKVDKDYEKRAKASILRMENSQKAVRGYQSGLLDPKLREAKTKAEKEFRAKVASNPELEEKYGSAWKELERINQEKIKLLPITSFYVPSNYSQALTRAVNLVQAIHGSEQAKKGVTATMNPSPTRDKFLAAHLARAKKWLGEDDKLVQTLLGNGTPEQAVKNLKASVVNDDAKVQAMLEQGQAALDASDDIAIKAALLIESVGGPARARTAALNTEESAHATRVGKALFAAYGNDVSPDATFTLRFSDGRVKGYKYNGTIAPFRTTFFGMFARNAEFDDTYPFNLPQEWKDAKDSLNMRCGVNFVATNDIIGGNSGSPIVNQDLEVIGLIFDGNIEMLGNRFLYRDDVPRSVSVHSAAILEVCSKIYKAQRIVDEIRGGS